MSTRSIEANRDGALLPLLERWRRASDDGDRDAAIELERTIIAALAPPDDGTGEARAAIGAAFVGALHAGSEDAARQVLLDQRESLEEAVQSLDGIERDPADDWVPASQIEGDPPAPLLAL